LTHHHSALFPDCVAEEMIDTLKGRDSITLSARQHRGVPGVDAKDSPAWRIGAAARIDGRPDCRSVAGAPGCCNSTRCMWLILAATASSRAPDLRQPIKALKIQHLMFDFHIFP
jgi:hypothetical protein